MWSGSPGTSSARSTTVPARSSQSALACFDVACWDLIGQELGVPIWKLLGGKFHERVPAYANGWYQAERDPVKIAALAKQVAARGYRGLKLDPFGHASAELDAAERRQAVAIVAAVREAVGADVKIMVEMHGRFTPAMAAGIAKMLEPFDPEWIEEPTRAGKRRWRTGPCGRPRICRSRPASARIPWKRFAASSRAAWWTWSRWTSRTSAASSR